MSPRFIVTVESVEPNVRADSSACDRSSGPALSSPIVNDGTALPRCRELRPRMTVESRPPLM